MHAPFWRDSTLRQETKKVTIIRRGRWLALDMEFQRHFLKVRDIDIVNEVGFKPANLVFQAMLVKLKKEGKGIRVHKPPIQNDDLKKLYDSFDLNVPADLQNKVFIEFMHYYCNRCSY